MTRYEKTDHLWKKMKIEILALNVETEFVYMATVKKNEYIELFKVNGRV